MIQKTTSKAAKALVALLRHDWAAASALLQGMSLGDLYALRIAARDLADAANGWAAKRRSEGNW